MEAPSFAEFLVNERNLAVAGINNAIAERDNAIAERDSNLNSTIWRFSHRTGE